MLEASIGWYPKSVDFIDALPVGKVLKKTLREPCRAGCERKI